MAEAATLARPYAKAAFMAARDSKSLADWSTALQVSAGMSLNSRISELLTDPQFSEDKVVNMFAGLGGEKIDQQWQNFVRLLAENKRLELFGAITEQYELLRAQFEGELAVEVTSAVALSDAQKTTMAASLKKRFKRDVRMSNAVDPSLLGGAVIRAGDQVIDGSIKGRLERLASDLAS
jgi:F-type H+-transporting ATPase subunit delta